jgi:protein TonB
VTKLAGPPPPPVVAPTGPLRVGGKIKEPRKTHDALPTYPLIAKAAHVEGTVVIEATIGKDGTVKDAHVVTSVPMLDAAALAAVRQWRYTVPTLNEAPVEVLMNVSVRFSLR